MLDRTAITETQAQNLAEVEAMRSRGYRAGDLARIMSMDLPAEATAHVDDRAAKALVDALVGPA